MNKNILHQSLISTDICAGLAAQAAVAEEACQKKQLGASWIFPEVNLKKGVII
ncbi:MAG: hypothetical protein HWE10_04760 [Gammaproteobacteria bacterium]|nr:hypothetical protein [Gammaproteobacteria bacterium]